LTNFAGAETNHNSPLEGLASSVAKDHERLVVIAGRRDSSSVAGGYPAPDSAFRFWSINASISASRLCAVRLCVLRAPLFDLKTIFEGSHGSRAQPRVRADAVRPDRAITLVRRSNEVDGDREGDGFEAGVYAELGQHVLRVRACCRVTDRHVPRAHREQPVIVTNRKSQIANRNRSPPRNDPLRCLSGIRLYRGTKKLAGVTA
jgi:hypothetical protein